MAGVAICVVDDEVGGVRTHFPQMTVAGCDPGISGAISILIDGQLEDSFDMPVRVEKSGRNKLSKYVDGAILARLMSKYEPSAVYLESVHSMPGQGVASSFKFGESTGGIRVGLEALGWTVVRVTPQKWKAHFGLIGTEKDAARLKAIELFPERAKLFARKKDIGRSDASLLSLYGYQHTKC